MKTEPKKLHTPCADLIRDRIEEYSHRFYTSDFGNKSIDIDTIEKTLLEALLLQFEEIEKSSVENILSEMPEGVCLIQMLDGSKDYKAYICFDCFDDYRKAYGKTPQLALKELQNKLNNK